MIALIPARAGSKGVVKKNIKTLCGYPLIAYSIAAARLCDNISKIVVSTDSKQIADISVSYGAEVPFLRPTEISQDNSTDLELFQHIINWFKENEGSAPDFLVHLRPTTPLRLPETLDKALAYILKYPKATSLRSAHQLPEPPQKMFKINSEGFFEGFFPDDVRPEYYNLPRQLFPEAYHPNGYVDIIKTDFVRKTGLLHGSNILAFVTPTAVEIDTAEDFDYLEYQIAKYGSPTFNYLNKNFNSISV